MSNLKSQLEHFQRLLRRNRAFRNCFTDRNGQLTDDAAIVMGELHYFCHARRPSYKLAANGVIDPYATHVAEGRREVLNRILDLLQLDPAMLDRKIKEINHQRQEFPDE